MRKDVKRTKRNSRSIRKPYFVLFLAVLLFSLSFLVFGGTKAKAETEAVRKYYTSISVKQGDSLWSIAKSFAPAYADIQAYVDELASINGIPQSSRLYPGRSLVVFYYR